MYARESVAVVIPCYASGGPSTNLIAELNVRLAHCEDLSIVLVNDRADDGLLSRLLKLAEAFATVVVVDLAKNQGQQSATLIGLQAVDADVAITMDDDGEHSPKDAAKAIETLTRNPTVDVVFIRNSREHRSGLRRLLSSGFDRLVRSASVRQWSSLRAIRRPLVRELCDTHRSESSLNIRIGELTARYEVVEPSAPPKASPSNYSWRQLVRMASNHVRHSPRLLVAPFVLAAVFVSLVSLGGASYFMTNRLRDQITIAGFATIVIVLLIVSALLFLGLATLAWIMMSIYRRLPAESLPVPRRTYRYREGTFQTLSDGVWIATASNPFHELRT